MNEEYEYSMLEAEAQRLREEITAMELEHAGLERRGRSARAPSPSPAVVYVPRVSCHCNLNIFI